MSHNYVQYYDEMFTLLYGKRSMLIYGTHDNPAKNHMPARYQEDDLRAHFLKRGFSVDTLDLFDSKANVRLDLNNPVPDEYHNKYDVVMDIGTIEHVFDIKQVLINSFNMIKVNGFYVLHTIANGVYRHGLYAINPEVIESALIHNGFTICYFKLSRCDADNVEEVDIKDEKYNATPTNLVLWCVAKKEKNIDNFICPQQESWRRVYA